VNSTTAPSFKLAPAQTIAQRLGRFYWNAAVPAADAGDLTTIEAITDRARSMLSDPRSKGGVDAFVTWWLGLNELNSMKKQHPRWTNDLRPRLRSSVLAFVRHVIFDDDGRFETLFTAPYAFADMVLGPLYGLPGGDGVMRKIPISPGERLGLTGQIGVLARYSPTQDPIWPARWQWPLADTLLCDTPWGARPFPMETPPPESGRSLRAQMEELTNLPQCSGCHGPYVNPFGYAFMRFDALGLIRPGSDGEDTSASIFDSAGREVRFSGQPDLVTKLVQRAEIRACIVRRVLMYAVHSSRGSAPTEVDAMWPVDTNVGENSLTWLRARFEVTGGDLKELLISAAQTEAFLATP
jgi:hypothetical protein